MAGKRTRNVAIGLPKGDVKPLDSVVDSHALTSSHRAKIDQDGVIVSELDPGAVGYAKAGGVGGQHVMVGDHLDVDAYQIIGIRRCDGAERVLQAVILGTDRATRYVLNFNALSETTIAEARRLTLPCLACNPHG